MIVAEHLRKTFPGKGKDKTPVVAVDDVGFTARDGDHGGLVLALAGKGLAQVFCDDHGVDPLEGVLLKGVLLGGVEFAARGALTVPSR